MHCRVLCIMSATTVMLRTLLHGANERERVFKRRATTTDDTPLVPSPIGRLGRPWEQLVSRKESAAAAEVISRLITVCTI